MTPDQECIAGLAAAVGAFCIWGLAPCTTFIVAVFLFVEPFITLDYAVTFACVWTALVLFAIAGWRHYRRARVPVRELV